MSPAHDRYCFPFIVHPSDFVPPSRTIDFQTLSHHQLTNPSSSNSFVLSSIQIPRVSNPIYFKKETNHDSAIR